MPWIVVRTQSRKEAWAKQNIERQNAECYVPRLSETEAMFPGYIFARTETGIWRFLQGTYGVMSIVMQGDGPAPLDPAEIALLRSLEREGFVELPEWHYAQDALFRAGDSVRVSEGPFIGLKGVVEGMSPHERVYVLLDMLGRKTPVELSTEALERVDPAQEARRNKR